MKSESLSLSTSILFGRQFVGEVVARSFEGETRGKVRVSIAGITDSFETNTIPWAAIMRPCVVGNSQGVGFFSLPRLGSKVVVIFEGGSLNSPVVIGEVSSPTNMPTLEDEHYGFVDHHSNSFQVTADGTILIESFTGQKLIVSASGKTVIISNEIELGASGLQPVVLGDNLKSWINDILKTWLDNHTHPGVGTPSSQFTPSDSNLYSTKNKTQ